MKGAAAELGSLPPLIGPLWNQVVSEQHATRKELGFEVDNNPGQIMTG